MARTGTRASAEEPEARVDADTRAVRGTVDAGRPVIGSAVPATRSAGSDEFLLRQILAAVQAPAVLGAPPEAPPSDVEDSRVLRAILEQLEAINQRLERIEQRLT